MLDSDSKEQAAQFTRIALPLMAKHGVATSPINYAVWYEYAASRNPKLRKEVESHIKDGQPFTAEFASAVFRRHFLGKDEADLLELRDQVQRILGSVLGNVSSLGEEAGRSADALAGLSADISGNLSPEELKRVAERIAGETRGMHEATTHAVDRLNAARAEVESLRRELEEVRAEATVDALTGVANRKAFDDALAEAIRVAADKFSDLCLVMGDIDHFKRFNDTHGHLVGDKVLRHVAQTMKQVVRGRDVVARYGGEEMAVILPETPFLGAMKVAESIRGTIETQRLKKRDTGESIGNVTVSLGVARFRASDTAESLIQRADRALYLSKQNGRNRVTGEDAL